MKEVIETTPKNPGDMNVGRSTGASMVATAFALLALAMGGCVAPSAPSDPTVSTTETKADTDSLGTVVGGDVSSVGQAAGVCTPLTCCFPTGQEWDGSAFQSSLRALGCTMPRAYAERYGSSDWWMFSQCTVSPALLTLIAQNATVAPIYAQLAVNECLVLDSVTALSLNTVFVQFDPTCSSCRTASK